MIAGTKVDARVVQQKKIAGFSHMTVTASLLCFGRFAAGGLVNGCFLCIIIYIIGLITLAAELPCLCSTLEIV